MSPGILAWWAACEREERARPRPEPPDPPSAPVYTTPPDPLVGSCEDLVIPERAPRNARRASEVRTTWIKGTTEQELGREIALRHGQLVAFTADQSVAVSNNGLAVFAPPLPAELQVGDADGFVEPRDQRLERSWGSVLWSADLTPAPGEELVVSSETRRDVLEGPLPLGASFAEALSARDFLDGAVPGLVTVTSEDWDGDGVVDLGLAWTGTVWDGVQQHPPEPYPVGGLAVYRGPVKPATSFLSELAPPIATYDPTAPDLYPEGGDHSGQLGVLVGDQDGDGEADVVVDGYGWEAAVPEDPLTTGGIAFFPGGTPGAVELDAAPLTLYGRCGSRLMDLQKVGDVTGDGLDDVVVIAHGAMNRGVVFVAPHLGDLTGHHSLATASRAIIVHDLSTADGSAFAHFTRATGMPDLDGNGVGELVLTDGFDGAAYIFLGPLSGVLNIGDADLTLEDGGQSFGSTVAVGDLDGDTLPDLAIGDPNYADVFPEFLGAISVFPGTALLAALEPR
jgi:hypothetical protein